MLPDRVSNPGPLVYESGALPIALRGPAPIIRTSSDGSGKFTTLVVTNEKLKKKISQFTTLKTDKI